MDFSERRSGWGLSASYSFQPNTTDNITIKSSRLAPGFPDQLYGHMNKVGTLIAQWNLKRKSRKSDCIELHASENNTLVPRLYSMQQF